MAKWKRSGLDAIREYEASSSYAKNIGAAQVAQQDRPNEKKWKRSGLDAIREYEASSNFPKTVAVRKYNAADREYNPSGTPALQKPKSQQHAQAAQEQRQKEQRRRNQLAVAAAAGAQADALQQSYYSYKQAGAPQAAQDAAYQNYAWARHQQDELNRANAMGRQLDPKEMQRLTTVRYRSPAQAAAQETAKNTPAAKNRDWADERTKKRQEQLSEQEFNRSSAMQKQYGSYNNYLRGVYAGYDEAVAKREAEQAKTSEDLRAESDALQTQIDELSDKLKTAYQNPSSENYKNFMELQQQWRETRKRKKEVDKRVSEKQTEERRAEQQAAQEAAQGKYGGWSEERMQGRLDELNRQINLALARSDGTADVSALKTEREALEEEKRRAYPTAGQKALNYLEDANDALMLAGTAQAMTGYEQTHAFAEAAANRAAAWALRDIANSAILRELGGEKYAEKLRSLADKMAVDVDYTGAQQWQEEYQRIMDEATKDHSGAGKWILEQLPSAGAMVVDMGMAGLFGVNAGTGAMNVTPLTMMSIRAGGSAALDAKNEGATDAQAALIGLENAAVEIFSEKLFGGNPLYDEDVGLVNKAVSKLTNSKTVMKVLDSKAFDFVSEGFEEVVAELLEPTFQSMVLHGTLDGATNAENIGNAFLGGVFLAALGKVAGAPAGLTQAQNERKAQQYAQVMSRIGMQSENAEVRAAAEAMQEKLDYGRTPDEADFGRLVNAMDAAGDMGAATEAVENAQQERQNQPETLGHYETMLVQAGIGVESAKSRVDVMERLVRGETVSDAELKKIQMGSKLSKQMLYEMSGVEIPEGITSDRDLMAYYRMAYESAQERASGESVRTAAQEAEQTTPEEQSVPAENTETPQAAGAPDEQKKTPKKPEVRAPEQSLQDARAMRDGGAAEADVLAHTGWIPLSSDSYLNPKTGEQVYFDGETVTVWQNGRGAQNAAQSNADAPVQEAGNVQQAEAYAQETQGAASAEDTANGQTAQEAPKSENSKPGLTMDEYVQTMLDNETAGKIDTVAKALGVNVRFVDAVEGGRANAQISGRQVLVEKNNRNPVMFLLGHEWTHRMQDAAPEQYRTFREAIMDEIRPQAQAVMENYARQGYEITEEAALDEAAADYAGRMIDDGTVLDEFIEKHRGDRTLLQKIADAIREMIRKLTGAERKKAETAEGKLLAAMDAAAENTKNAASDGGTRYSAKSGNEGREATQAEITTRYQQSVHDILNGASSTSDALLVGYTPEVYQKLGMPDLPFVVGSGHVYSMAKTADEASAEGKFHKGVNYHGLGESVVADILDFVKDPVMVISAKDVDAKTTPMRSTHSVVALIDVGTGKESMVIPVAITAERTVNGMRMDVNAISSAYEKNTTGLVNEAIAQFNAGENSVFYVKKGAANLLGAGVQFPEQLKAAASSDGIVRKFDSKINMSVQNVTESQQFKRWFGDWQNHPERASKVVNADGTPKIMYRGGNETFNIFDRKKSKYSNLYGRGFYFTDSESHARQYGDVRAYYLDVKNPVSTQEKTITKKQMRNFLEAVAENEDYGLENYGYGATVDSVLKDVYGKNDFSMLYDVNQTAIGDMVAAVELFNEVNGTDYDGLILDTETVVFNGNQIKSATDNVGTFDRNNPDIRYSLKNVDGKQVVWIDNNPLTSKELRNHKSVAEYIAQHIGEVYTIIESGQKVYLGEDLPGEYTQSRYTSYLNRNDAGTLKAKNKAASGLGELIETAANRRWEKTIHPDSKDAKYGMYRYDSSFAFPVKQADGKISNVSAYDVELLIRNASDGKKYLYDIVGIKENTTVMLDLLKRENQKRSYTAPAQGDVPDTNISATDENVNRKFSLKETTAEERKQHDNDALSYFGKTYKWSETGYVLLNGSRLDFSGRHEGGPGGYRTVDHRDIVDALGEDFGGGDYSGGMVQFMQEGNIRISPESGGINLAVMPTKAQMDSLSDFISKERGAVILDIDDANGNTISSTEYPRGTHANRVLQDIRNYFNAGITPEVSSTPTVSQFRDSLKGAEVSREYADVLKENELLKERVDYWKGQTKRTDRATTNEKSVSREATSLVKRYGAELDASDIQGDLQSLYDAMANGELDGKEAFSQAKEIAGKLVENAVEADDELYQSYKDLRNFLRTTKLTISEEDGKNIPDLAELRKRNFGRMTIGKGQTNIDQVYQELADQWPEFFDEDAVSHPADQLQQIADVLGNIYTITEQNPYQGYMEQAKTAAANEILDDFFELPQTRKTFADRQAAALSEAKAKGKAQAQKVREQKNAQLADLREKNRARVNSILEKERTRRADQINKLKEQYKSRDTAAKDRREARELRNKIIRHTKGLSQKLLRPTDKQHIPEILKHEVAAMLESINMEDNYTLDPATIREGKVGKDGKTTLYGEKLRGADRNEKGVMTRRSEAFEALKAKYTQIVKDGDAMTVDPYLLGNNSEGIKGGFDEVIDMKDTPLADLSKSQLQTMWNVVRAVEHSVSTYGKMLSNVKFTETQNWADALKRDTEGRRERTGGLLLDFETPYTFFSHYGDAGTSIYRMLRDAQDRQQLMVNDVTEQTRKIVDPKTVKEMEKQTHTFKLASGKELTLTTAQVMDLYNLMQRKQAHDHLIKGGVMQPEIKDRKIRRGTESLRLTEADLVNIAGSLTEEQTKIAQGLQKLTSGVLADYGNEASMRAYGYKKFTEQNYWPIKSAKEGIYSNVEKGGNQDRSIKNIGMAKQTTPEAGNALEISSIFDTFSNHASDMTDYAAWLCAMEDANRLFNFRFKDGAGNLTGETIRGLLEKYGGKGAQSYWTKLMGDIQNGINTKEFTPATQAATKLIGGFKGAAVGGNIRVVIQQPTAFFRASAVLSPLDMARGLAGGVTKGGGWKRALEYSPIAMRKGNGSFDISAPYTMKQTLFDNRDAIRKVNDFLSAPAGAADAVTWGRLWNACEWAVKRGYPNLKPGSKAFYEQTARQFAEVIDQTQVVDGVLQRSNIMRAKNEITKQATSFKGEPIMSINLLVRTIDAFTHETSKEKKSAAAKKIGRAAAALLVTDVVNAFAQSIIDGIRDDDKDKKWWKRVMSAFTGQTGEEETAWEKGWNFVMEGNLGGNLNKAASMPYLADVFSLMQGYEVARTDTEVINDIVRASQTLIKSLGDDGKKTWVYATKATLGATAKLFGLPLNNLTRDIWGVLRSVAIETDNIPLQYEMEKMIWDIDNHSNSGKFGELLYKSLTLGDTEAYQNIRGEMQKRMGLDDSRIKSILRGHVKDDYTGRKMTQAEAITFLVKHGIEKDKDAAFWKIQEWDSGDEEDYTKFGELSDAVLNGGKSSTGATVDELVEWYVEHGTKRSTVQSGITSAVHEAYKGGTIDEETVANLLKQYQVYDEGEKGYQTDDDIYWTVREWTAQYNGDEDYHKYDSVYDVVENGGNLKDVIREYTENGTEEKTIASALTSHYKPLYIAASASERKKMKEYLVKAYAALGRDKEKARKDIDKWLEE